MRPGCCIATKNVRLSGVKAGPHTSHPVGADRNWSARPRKGPSVSTMKTASLGPSVSSMPSVATQSRPWSSKAKLSGTDTGLTSVRPW